MTYAVDRMSEVWDVFRALEVPTHPRALEFLAFWNARAEDGIVIGRDVPSRRIAGLLSHLIVFEPTDGGSDCRVRLAGDSIRLRFDRDITGMLMSELFPPAQFREHIATTHAVIGSQTPVILDSRLTNGAVEKMHLEVVILPAISPDRVANWTLVGLFYFD
ncbi:MAG: PAS domain-containing protein [Alphaproteobacteria bacterium]|nr:PAS domain-containing protein [Alphaproteobacteria bacterium]MDE2162500.1 PAS domain-containing protein [Alphaproteobacteria bacterium]MDE2501213.1 PAS domain-containing protein [Alphaproteobacteria bacterium]